MSFLHDILENLLSRLGLGRLCSVLRLMLLLDLLELVLFCELIHEGIIVTVVIKFRLSIFVNICWHEASGTFIFYLFIFCLVEDNNVNVKPADGRELHGLSQNTPLPFVLGDTETVVRYIR